jgi:hypothetical protein
VEIPHAAATSKNFAPGHRVKKNNSQIHMPCDSSFKNQGTLINEFKIHASFLE